MKVIENCWDAIGAAECEYGAHLFDGSVAKIYVSHGLDVGLEMSQLFIRKNDEGYAGHCLLVFNGIKSFDFVINQYEMQGGNPMWHDPITTRYSGDIQDGVSTYHLAGGLYGFEAYVSIEIEARSFELHILEKDDPVHKFC
ncbi:hypothetical protein [Herbaspirillum rubrisubalbicans]|uniref:hypothetical protein n=1 Tax=Herbaspirillum rubrisubalbicans TaxID=80842 RepID=UPI0011BEB5B6|nr:hypothetical protein [Herbaspirillum rubrisubalbicans]